MGIFDNLAGGLKTLLSGQKGENNLIDTIGGLITDSNTGGLSGLVKKFKDNGLDEIVSSWISTGKNLPISADQLQKVVNPKQIENVAKKLGVSAENASDHLAEYLPRIIDKLTPDGALPSSDQLVAKGLEMLRGKLTGK